MTFQLSLGAVQSNQLPPHFHSEPSVNGAYVQMWASW